MSEDPDAVETLALAREFLKQQAELGLDIVPRPADGENLVAAPGSGIAPQPDAEADPAQGEDLSAFADRIANCRACRLAEGRSVVVFGSGNPDADVMFVGEAPGAEEDRQGAPFVGEAGKLLTRMIEAIGLQRSEVYIANVIKCRPPGNRDPQPDEIAACKPYLMRQIDMIQPRVICTLGRFAAQTLLKSTDSMGKLRGRAYDYQGVALIPTYHPAALLRNPQWKYPTWEDLKLLRKIYDGTEL